MFIELTDHLRCPAGHAEAYLVLLPGTLDARRVQEGVLGCPVCHAEYPVAEGTARFGDPPAPPPTALPPDAAHALLGLTGPGGYVTLVGGAGSLANGLSALLPGIRLVLVNPPAGVRAGEASSVLLAPRLPLKAGSMRGAVISADHAADQAWRRDTLGCVLPGLRVVGEGPPPEGEGVLVLAEAGGWWVGRRGS